ncbi:hypothetical protein GCM10010452_56360 [Crossiella cryophila]
MTSETWHVSGMPHAMDGVSGADRKDEPGALRASGGWFGTTGRSVWLDGDHRSSARSRYLISVAGVRRCSAPIQL